MKVTIIVAVYNGEHYIKETLNSILNQTYRDFEVIIVDDKSQDKTIGIIESFDDKRIRLIKKKENSGSPVAPRNIGIKSAKGDFIAFCDQDDIWYPEKLQKQLDAPKNKNIGLVVSSADIINEKGKKIGDRYLDFDGYLSPEKSFRKLLGEDFITNCSAILPKKVIEEVGFLDEDLKGNDEYDLWLKLAINYGIWGIKEPLCAWRVSGNALSKNISSNFQENKKIFAKLKGKDTEEERFIAEGEERNRVRLFVALVNEKKFDEARRELINIKSFSGIKKVEVLAKIFRFSPLMSFWVVTIFKKLKKHT